MPTITEITQKYHWIKIAEDGVVEMYLDHHSLQTFRTCEAAFELSIMANLKSKQKAWSLEFGILFHKMIEEFYIAKQADTFDFNAWLALAVMEWNARELDSFSEHKMYQSLRGCGGFLTMLTQYADHFAKEVDRLRIIGLEIAFGKNKEVPLGDFVLPVYYKAKDLEHFAKTMPTFPDHPSHHVRCYLTGRIDFLMDSGSAIGPLDHKTSAFFKGSPAAAYDPQEGMTGYIYATKHILNHRFPELLQNRKVDRIWMNFAQITPDADPMKRFRRVPIFKTDWQLEEYRLRQIRTFHKIYDMLVFGERPDWSTDRCNNMFHSECQYKNLHRQNTSSNMFNILKQDFNVGEAWNPETVVD